MSYKTILVHCDASKTVSHRLAVAVQAAERFGAHLVGFHARTPFEAPMLADGGGFPMDDFFKAYDEAQGTNYYGKLQFILGDYSPSNPSPIVYQLVS